MRPSPIQSTNGSNPCPTPTNTHCIRGDAMPLDLISEWLPRRVFTGFSHWLADLSGSVENGAVWRRVTMRRKSINWMA